MRDNKSWYITFTDGSDLILKDVPPGTPESEVRKELQVNPASKNKKIATITPPGGADKPLGPGNADAPSKVPPKVPPKQEVPPKEVPPRVPPKQEVPPKKVPPAPPVSPPKETPAPAPDDSVINDIVKQKEAEARAKAEQAKKEAAEAAEKARKSKEDADRQEALKKQEEARIAQQKAEQAKKEADAAAEKERVEKERQQNQPAPVVPPKKEEPPKETPPAATTTPPKETPPATTTTPPATTTAPPAKTKEQKRAEVEARLQELEKSNDPAVRAQAAEIRKKLNKEGGQATQQSNTPPATSPSKVPTPSDQIGGTSDKPSTNAGPGKTGDQPGNNQGPGKTTGDGTKPGDGTGNKADGGKGKDGQGDKGTGTGTSGQGYWKDIGDNMVMWKGAPGTDSTFPGQSFKDGDIMPNPKYTVPTGGKGDDKYSSNNAEELRRQNRLKDEEIRKLKLRAGIK